MKYTLFIVLFLIAVVILACQSASNQGGPAPKEGTLVAARVDQVVSDSQASIWERAPKLELTTAAVYQESAPPGPRLMLQAIYDANNIAIRVEWEDPTESILRNAWTWDGKSFSRSGDEDRLMFHFPMTNDANFASKGCAAICHNQEDDPEKWYMASDDKDVRYDQWHWKSTRTHPVGQADDKWLGTRADPLDTESAHYGDAKEGGGEAPNINEQGNGPLYVNGAHPDSPFIIAGQETVINHANLTPGVVIPGYVLAPITGSRGDLKAVSRWANGRWVVVIVRAMNTGHDDDVLLIPPKPLPFGVAVVDNGGSYKHWVVQEVITLAWE